MWSLCKESVHKYVRGGVNLIIDDSLGWGVNICVDAEVCRSMDGEVRM